MSLSAASQTELIQTASQLTLLSTGEPQVLQDAAQRWLPRSPAQPACVASKLVL